MDDSWWQRVVEVNLKTLHLNIEVSLNITKHCTVWVHETITHSWQPPLIFRLSCLDSGFKYTFREIHGGKTTIPQITINGWYKPSTSVWFMIVFTYFFYQHWLNLGWRSPIDEDSSHGLTPPTMCVAWTNGGDCTAASRTLAMRDPLRCSAEESPEEAR